MLYAVSKDEENDFKKTKVFLDYIGSYLDSERAKEEFNIASANDESETEFDGKKVKIVPDKIAFEKAKPPRSRMNEEKRKRFEEAMKQKFGSVYGDFDKEFEGKEDASFEFDEIKIHRGN